MSAWQSHWFCLVGVLEIPNGKEFKDASIRTLYPVFGFGVSDGKGGGGRPSKATLVATSAKGELGRRDAEMQASQVCGFRGWKISVWGPIGCLVGGLQGQKTAAKSLSR